jgi:hypothetical protein
MKYSKPQLTQIGDATVLIANPTLKLGGSGDGSKLAAPAYDLDE